MDEEELSGLVNLEELWIGKNKIEEIRGLEKVRRMNQRAWEKMLMWSFAHRCTALFSSRKLTKLRRLDVQSNRLTKITNLTTQVDTLEELYLAHNGINDEGAAQTSGLALPFTNLTTLDLSRNCLTSTQAFAHLTSLEDLWLSGNKIATFDAVQPLSVLGTRDGACLEELYLEYNPVADEFEYRKKLKEMIPSLTKIDANMIGGAYGGMVSGGQAMTREEQLSRMQEQVVARARAESGVQEGGSK